VRGRGRKMREYKKKRRRVALREKAGPEPGGPPKHVMMARGEPDTPPLAEGRRAAPQIDRHIQHRTCHYTDQLPLGPAELIMNPAQHMPAGQVVVVLPEAELEPRGCKLALLPRLEEMPAYILIQA